MDKETWHLAIQVASWTVNILAFLVALGWIAPDSILTLAMLIVP